MWRPVPTNVRDLRKLLGFTGYYRKYIKDYALISRVLTDLLKKHQLFVWTQDHQQAFQTLKLALLSAPVLALPDFKRSFLGQSSDIWRAR